MSCQIMPIWHCKDTNNFSNRQVFTAQKLEKLLFQVKAEVGKRDLRASHFAEHSLELAILVSLEKESVFILENEALTVAKTS